MARAIVVALGTGALITSAAALGLGAADGAPRAAATTEYEIEVARQEARGGIRSRIEARYETERAACEPLTGFKREKCLVKAHANRGRALLAEAAPYQARH